MDLYKHNLICMMGGVKGPLTNAVDRCLRGDWPEAAGVESSTSLPSATTSMRCAPDWESIRLEDRASISTDRRMSNSVLESMVSESWERARATCPRTWDAIEFARRILAL
jgi:hypothetical protein